MFLFISLYQLCGVEWARQLSPDWWLHMCNNVFSQDTLSNSYKAGKQGTVHKISQLH